MGRQGCSSGECQTWYQISRIPAAEVRANPEMLPMAELCDSSSSSSSSSRNEIDVYEVVKSRNFDKCRILPVFNYLNTRDSAAASSTAPLARTT